MPDTSLEFFKKRPFFLIMMRVVDLLGIIKAVSKGSIEWAHFYGNQKNTRTLISLYKQKPE